MMNMTNYEFEEFRSRMFLADKHYEDAWVALNCGCTHDAIKKLNTAKKYYKEALQITINKNAGCVTEARMGIQKCNELLTSIKNESKEM